MEELYELIKAGYSNAEILAMNNDYILNIERLDRVRTELLIDKFKNTRMEELYELIKAGYSNAEILAMNNDYILNIERLDRVRTELLIDKFKNTRRTDLKVIYISGATGTGKTRGILDKHGDGNVYRVNDYEHPFDGYSCQ